MFHFKACQQLTSECSLKLSHCALTRWVKGAAKERCNSQAIATPLLLLPPIAAHTENKKMTPRRFAIDEKTGLVIENTERF